MYPNQGWGMDHSEGVTQAPAGTVVPQELLEEMLWFYRVEDASPWNISIFALVGVVVVISIVLLERSIRANRKHPSQQGQLRDKVAVSRSSNNELLPYGPSQFSGQSAQTTAGSLHYGQEVYLENQKMLPPEKQTPEVLYLAEAGTKDDNSLNILRETLLSEKPNLAQVEIELKERDVPPVLLADPQESESQ